MRAWRAANRGRISPLKTEPPLHLVVFHFQPLGPVRVGMWPGDSRIRLIQKSAKIVPVHFPLVHVERDEVVWAVGEIGLYLGVVTIIARQPSILVSNWIGAVIDQVVDRVRVVCKILNGAVDPRVTIARDQDEARIGKGSIEFTVEQRPGSIFRSVIGFSD